MNAQMTLVAALCCLLPLWSPPAFADEAPVTPSPQEQEHAPMPPTEDHADKMEPGPAMRMGAMDMDSMQGGGAPPDARDPNAYSDGYEYTGMPGMEQSDRIAFGKVLVDELEVLSGNEGEGYAWQIQGTYGGDRDKLWLRTQGLKYGGQPVDPTTDVEALWWRGTSPFWGTQLGVRQDLGPGAHTWIAFGVEGLAPYWFEVQATGYVGDDGRLSARLKASYDLLFTNRLILTPGVESNVYSKAEPERGLGTGVGNIELGLRLRYEIRRKFAPYIGYVWERSFAGTADRSRADGEPVTECRFVAGMRLWF